MWGKRPTAAKREAISAAKVAAKCDEIDAYLEGIKPYIDPDLYLSLIAQAEKYKRLWASRGLEQWKL